MLFNFVKVVMLIADTRGHCFVRTQHEFCVTVALKVPKTSNYTQENRGLLIDNQTNLFNKTRKIK